MTVMPLNKLHFLSFMQYIYSEVPLKLTFIERALALSVRHEDQSKPLKLYVDKLKTGLDVIYYPPVSGTVTQRHSWLCSCTVLTLHHCILILVSCEQGHSQHASSCTTDDLIADGKSSVCFFTSFQN